MEALKNIYSPSYIAKLGRLIKEVYAEFDQEAFTKSILSSEWEGLELKARASHICKALHRHIQLPYQDLLAVLIKIGPQCGNLEGIFLPEYLEKYGFDEDWELNMYAFEHITPSSTAEFAVRPFILKDPESMMGQMFAWSSHENEHVRRLASEGCRPRLPWGMGLKPFQKDPSLILPVLENLKDDSSEYVRRSVANNLNDISKDHPRLVLQLAERWLSERMERKRLIKHALRTLLKKGNTEALMLFGFGDPEKVKAKALKITPDTIGIGEKAEFGFELKVDEEHILLRLEYAIDFLKKNGKHSRKVFQLTEKEFKRGQHFIQKKHSFQQLTTRTHYPGLHHLIVLVNGREKAASEFYLQ